MVGTRDIWGRENEAVEGVVGELGRENEAVWGREHSFTASYSLLQSSLPPIFHCITMKQWRGVVGLGIRSWR